MKIERIKVDLNEMLEKSFRFRKIIKNNGMTEAFIGIDSQGNKRFEIKHTRPPQRNSTVIVRIFGYDTRDLIGGGNSSYADAALLEALKAIGFEVEANNLTYWNGLKREGIEEVMTGIMKVLGCKQAIKVFDVTSE